MVFCHRTMVEYLVEPILKSKVHMGGTLITKRNPDYRTFLQNAFLFVMNLRYLSQNQWSPFLNGYSDNWLPFYLFDPFSVLKRSRSI